MRFCAPMWYVLPWIRGGGAKGSLRFAAHLFRSAALVPFHRRSVWFASKNSR